MAASANVQNLVSIAENLVKKRLALKDSAPVIFETFQNIDDQIRIAINAVVDSGEEEELTADEIYLVNNALSGTRSSLVNFEKTYTPDETDIVGELRDVKSVDFKALSKLQENDKDLYNKLIELKIYTPSK